MARVPVVESPCPIVGKPLPAGATEHCTLCERSVHNLDRMSDRERREFMSSCSGKVCVAYTVKIPVSGIAAWRLPSLAAATLVAHCPPPRRIAGNVAHAGPIRRSAACDEYTKKSSSVASRKATRPNGRTTARMRRRSCPPWKTTAAS